MNETAERCAAETMPSHFGVSSDELQPIVARALRGGGDYADLFFQDTTGMELTLRDSAVSKGVLQKDYGVGVRCLKGERSGYAYSSETNREAMLRAAGAASLINAGATDVTPLIHSRSSRQEGLFYTLDGPLLPPEGAIFFPPLLRQLEALIREKDSRIVKVLLSLSLQQTHLLMFNSLGELRGDAIPGLNLSAVIICRSGSQTIRKSLSRSLREGWRVLSPAWMRNFAERLCEGLDDAFSAIRPKGGEMPVVMGAGASGILLHEAMGHAFEADFNRKGTSVFTGQMGRRICAPNVSIVDDATLPGYRGSCHYDDEGVPGQRTVMVDHGILSSYLHDRISAACYGVAPTGNGRREDFRCRPLPRMRNTYMENGDSAPQDIIASVSRGIYVNDFSNGQVKIGEGDFTFYVRSGYLIENGRLTRPVKDINVIGNGPKALGDIVAVGNDALVDRGMWTCGKDGQSVPVSCGMPTVLVSRLTVGGE